MAKPTKRSQTRQRSGNNLSLLLSVFIVILLIFTTVKKYPQLIEGLVLFNHNYLEKVTNEIVVEFDGPVIPGNNDELNKNKFAAIDKQATFIAYYGDSVTELADILSQYATTDLDKARLIYSWITHNIAYDTPALLELLRGNYPDISTQKVLTTKKTICSGYANLYQNLAQKMGLNSVIILGYAKSFGYLVGDNYQVNHAWNGVQINNKWYLIDATWGAGKVVDSKFQPEFNPYYFAVPPGEFIYSHFPREFKWQLLAQPYSRKRFNALPEISAALFENQIKLVSHKNKKIDTKERLTITLKAPENIVAIAKLTSGGNSIADNYTFVQRQEEYIKISAAFPHKGNYVLDIFAKQKDNSNYYPHAVAYQIVANNQSEKFPVIYSHFTKHDGYLETPFTQSLYPNQLTYFHLKVDRATEVKVVDQSTNNWTNLIKYGNLFAGTARVGTGKVVVFAKFPGDSRYWALLEYN